MEEPKLSVRQWQEQFQSGAFSAPDLYTQCTAGWSDWFCQDHALAGRLKKIGRIVMGVRDPFILDNYYVWFKNNCPLSGPLYDHVTFTPLSASHDGKGFSVVQDSPHEPYKWTLYTARYGYDSPEFGCRNIREMLLYVNRLGPELQQGFVPAFVQEKAAVAAYAKARGEPLPGLTRRGLVLSAVCMSIARRRRGSPPWTAGRTPNRPITGRRRRVEQAETHPRGRASRQAAPAPGGGDGDFGKAGNRAADRR